MSPFLRGISRNNLSNANENLDWRIYAECAQILSVSVFEKMPLLQAFQSTNRSEEGGDFCNQLSPWN